MHTNTQPPTTNAIDQFISELSFRERKRLTLRQLELDAETFQRMRKAYEEMFERQLEFSAFQKFL